MSILKRLAWNWYGFVHSISGIGEVARKHRAAILFISACLIFFDPNVTLTLGRASVAGLGMSIDPVQVISIGLVLFAALVYRLIAFWIFILTESGVDFDKAKRRAKNEIDPDIPDESYGDLQHVINRVASDSVYNWKFIQIIWETLLPTAIALFAIFYFCNAYFFI